MLSIGSKDWECIHEWDIRLPPTPWLHLPATVGGKNGMEIWVPVRPWLALVKEEADWWGEAPSTAPLLCSADAAVAPFFSPCNAMPFLSLAAAPFGILAAAAFFSGAAAAPTDSVPQLPPAPLVSPFFVDGFQGCEGNLELGEIYGRKLARMDGILPPCACAATPKLRCHTGSNFTVAGLYNGAGGGDKALEHEPLSSFREATARSSAGSRGGFTAKLSTYRQQKDKRCTCP
jgi:hypothetical protein